MFVLPSRRLEKKLHITEMEQVHKWIHAKHTGICEAKRTPLSPAASLLHLRIIVLIIITRPDLSHNRDLQAC